MLRRWLSTHRSALISTISASLVAGLIATVAVVSGGYEAQRLDLGDGSVWVANGSEQAIGRANTQIAALDTVVATTGTEIEVIQDESTVLIVDRSENRVDIVDDATAEVLGSVPLPPEQPRVYLADDTVVVHAAGTGEVWVVPVAEFSDFDPEVEPTRTFGADSVASLSPDGVLFVYSPDAREVYRLDTTDQNSVTAAPASFGDSGDPMSITSVSNRWVLLNERSGDISIEGRIVALGGVIPDGGAVLPEPTATGDRILIAHPRGLVQTTLAGADPEELTGADAASTVAVPPVIIGECAYGAWSSGTSWRECGGEEQVLSLESVPAGAARLEFVQRDGRVALSDPRSGLSWAVQADGELMNNWDDLIVDRTNEQEVEENDQNVDPVEQKEQLPPVAVDDEFGARPGRASVLPVLLNDYDPNRDVLVVAEVAPIDESIGRVDVVNERQQLQLTLAPTASGTVTFDYTVSDGRGGVATATVVVPVRQPGENNAPVQARPSRAVVEVGGRVTSQVLGDWVDPDGDAFYLTTATAAAPDAVTFEPVGTVVFDERGGAGDVRSVGLAVSDGTATGSGAISITVFGVGAAPLVADPSVVTAYAGLEITVDPLTRVRGGGGDYRLTSVPAQPGSTVEASLETGTFRFVSDQVRSHFIGYTVNDGDRTASGIIRVDVLAPPDVNSTPITTPKTIFVRTQGTETIDIAASDSDPAGGVLLLTAVDDIPTASGAALEILDQSVLRVTLIGPLSGGSFSFGYRVSNGLAEATGTVTVIEIPLPSRYQPPIAADDTAVVRVGDAIDIPVLDNDQQPDGGELVLNPELTSGLPRSAGLLFVSGGSLRYLAPQRTGDFTAVYQVAGPDGQVDQAAVTISVREAVEETNAAPVPAPIVARVLAGETVRIPIPLTGIDPDGDSVQLIGQETNPEKGSVTDTGADYIEYLAGDYSAGTDIFTYTVIDTLGARATGTVRVGIAPRTQGARNPIAIADAVSIRPGRTVSVQVLANDSDPDGGALTVTAVDPNAEDIVAEIVDGEVVDITPPAVEGEYGLVYTVENQLGGTDSNFITVKVDDAAPPSFPEARDTVLTLADILDRETVDVDVLRNVFFADGPTSSLDIALLPGYDTSAEVTGGNRIRVTIEQQRQIIPFAVTNPDDASRVSYAFVWVPGLADALPQLDRTRRAPSVASEATLTIDLNDYVLAVGGRDVRLADSTTVRATNANGDNLVVDDQTLRFVSSDLYFGPASISFEVTDGDSATDQDGRRATIVLPITVTSRENQPPVFAGGIVDFEPGQERTLDLLRLTDYDNVEDLGELRYSAIGTPPAGFSYTITGSELVVRADESVQKGTSSTLTLGVRDATSEGQSGRLQLEVVASTRPLARPASDLVVAPRGRTTTVDVLANDQATNPFPGEPLRVVGIRGLDGSAVPPGVAISPSADNSRISVTVDSSAEPVDTNLQYQLADVTGDPDRYVYGSVRISVQDRPDPPVAPARADGGFEEGQLTLRLTAPVSNNSPITNYVLTSGSYRRDCGTQLRCALTDLAPGKRYQFTLTAVNAVGASTPSPLSVEMSADYLPAAPATVSATATAASASGAIAVAWARVPDPDPGSSVTGYVVRVVGPGVDFSRTIGAAETGLTTTAQGSLVPNAQYAVRVYARNSALVLSEADWRRSATVTVTTVGPPGQVSGLRATSINAAGDIVVAWGPSDPNGAADVTYRVLRIPAGAGVPDCGPGVGTPRSSGWTDTSAEDGDQVQYVVYADNRLFCTPAVSATVESKRAPGPAVGTVERVAREDDSGQYDLRAGGLGVLSGMAMRFEAQLNGGAWVPVGTGDWLTSAGNAQVYGNAQTVLFRGCRDVSTALCGPPSAASTETPVDTRASIVSCVFGQDVIVQAPRGTDALTVTYSYAFDAGLGFGEYGANPTAPDPRPLPFGVEARVKASVTIGGVTLEDPGFDQISCSE